MAPLYCPFIRVINFGPVGNKAVRECYKIKPSPPRIRVFDEPVAGQNTGGWICQSAFSRAVENRISKRNRMNQEIVNEMGRATFTPANAREREVRVDLAAMFRLTHMMGWDDTIWNHITARVPGTDHHFLMHRFGLLYEEVTASNLIKVDENGNVLEGSPGYQYSRVHHPQCHSSQPSEQQVCFSCASPFGIGSHRIQGGHSLLGSGFFHVVWESWVPSVGRLVGGYGGAIPDCREPGGE